MALAKASRTRYNSKIKNSKTCDISNCGTAGRDAISDVSWKQPVTAQKRLRMATRSTHEHQQPQMHDHQWCEVLSGVSPACLSSPIAGVAVNRHPQPSVGPWRGTRAQCCYGSGKQAWPVDIWCVPGLATSGGPKAMERLGRTCVIGRWDVLQHEAPTAVDQVGVQGRPLV